MNKITLLVLLIIIPSIIYSQRPTQGKGPKQDREVFEIKGIVLERTSGLPLEFTTVIVKPLKGPRVFGGLTDQKGRYSVEVPKGRYTISYEFLSFKTVTLKDVEISTHMNLETVGLEEDAEALDEVEIIAESIRVMPTFCSTSRCLR